VDRPTREVLYTVLGPEEKYKSKSFIDTFVYRAGDLAGVWVKRFAGAGHLFIWIALAISGAWLACAFVLGSLHRRQLTTTGPPPPVKCTTCGYDLAGATGPVCPECGSPLTGAHEKAAPASGAAGS